MKTESSRYDFVPYPWPVKPALLFLLGLPWDATEEEYIARWNKAVEPAQKGEWAKAQFLKEVERYQAAGLSYDQAWGQATTVSPLGKKAYAVWQRKK